MATYDTCEICCDDKLVVPCSAGGVCDKKVCIECTKRLDTPSFDCIFCFQKQPRLEIVFEIEDLFCLGPGQCPPKIDAYIKRYNVWSYGCLEIPECECDYCREDSEDEIMQKIFEFEMSNP